MLDIQTYKSSLLEFLQLVESLNEPKWLVAEHLRFPAFEHSTLSGSQFGRDLWEHATAQQLMDVLLIDDDLRRWFGLDFGGPSPESRLNELRAHIASLVQRWDQHEATPEEIVAEWADLFLQAVKNPEPTCSRLRVLFGVSVQQRIELPPGIALEPAAAERLRQFLAGSAGFEREALRIPRRPAALLWTTGQVKREEFGPFAATMANGGADVLAEQARWDIWLATGVLPRLGDAYVYEQSRFPVAPSERYPASQRETHARAMDTMESAVDGGLLLSIHQRMAMLRHEGFPEEAMMPLWVADAFIHTAIDAADDLVTVLLAHAATEGLLLQREDPKSRFVPRLALLIQRDRDEGRRLRRVTQRWTGIRDFAAHGRHPLDSLLGPFIEQEAPAGAPSPFLAGDPNIWLAARRRASALLRRVFLAVLFCCVALDNDGSPLAQFSRDDVIAILERAVSGDQSARQQITETVPQFVRDIEL